MDTKKFVRKSFEIEAVQVADNNMQEIADWCGGEIEQEGSGPKFIRVKVNYPLNPRQTQAFFGDWVLGSPKGYKVYTDNAFKNNFVSVGPIVSQEENPVDTPLDEILQRRLNKAEAEALDNLVQEKVEEALSRIGNSFEFHLQHQTDPGTPVNDKDAINGKR